jgi:uncharacterized protein YacL
LLYTLASGVFVFGIFVFMLVYFAESAGYGDSGLMPAVATLMVFALPGAAFGVFLILTERDRRKPWVVKRHEEYMRRADGPFSDPILAQKFGLICGALWIAAITGFILLTISFGLMFSWLAFAAALIAQMVVMASFTKHGNKQAE